MFEARAAVFFAVSMLAGALVGSVASIATAKPLEPSPEWKDGAQVYAKVCGYCHDTGVAPALLGRQLPPPLVTAFARNGIRAMPAFRAAEIDDAALAKVAEYISKH
jgi:mono/diheme cytochrome c family protein